MPENKSLGRTAYEEWDSYRASQKITMEPFFEDLRRLERDAWEAAAQAVRKAVIEELIERELPPHVTQTGIDAACDSESGEDIQPTDRAFRAMLRSLKGETDDA